MTFPAPIPGNNLSGGGAYAVGVLENRRAVLVSRSYFPDDPRLARQVSALCGHGADVAVICLRRPASREPALEKTDGGVVVRRLGGTRHRSSRLHYVVEYGTFLCAAAVILAREHLRRPFSLVQVANPPDPLVLCGLPQRLAGAALVLDIHDLSPELYASKFAKNDSWPLGATALAIAERVATSCAHHVVVAGEPFRSRLVERGLAPARVTSIPNGPDERLFDARLRTTPRTEQLVYHGSLFDRYDVALALEALPAIRMRCGEARLDVWGDGPELETLRARGEQQFPAGVVKFHDYVSLDQIPSFIANAACGLSTLRSDRFTELAFPTKVAEYAQLGVPVAASRTRALTQVFPEDAIAFYPPGDAAGLAGAVVGLLEQPQLAAAQALRARDIVTSLLWSRHAERYVSLVSSLVSDRPTRQ
jgi:glycosyltransferase involved in cell wall biosynthesis